MFCGVPYRLPDGTWGVAVGEVDAGGSSGSEGGKLVPTVGDTVLVLPKTRRGLWFHRVTEVYSRKMNRHGICVHICRTRYVRAPT